MDDQEAERRLHSLNDCITTLEGPLLSCPKNHPFRPCAIHCLARSRFYRYTLSHQRDDLEAAIVLFTEAIFLPYFRIIHPKDSSQSLNIVQVFYYLTLGILQRAEEFKQHRGVKDCAMYLRYIRERWHEVHLPFDPPLTVAGALLCASYLQVVSGLVDADQDIEEMVDLCDELLNSDISIVALTTPMHAFVKGVGFLLELPEDWQNPPEKVINCLRRASTRLPVLPEFSVALVLARCLYNRFVITHSDDDYREGVEILNKLINIRYHGGYHGDRRNQHRYEALRLALLLHMSRLTMSGKPEYLELAIYHARAFLEENPPEAPNRHFLSAALGHFQGMQVNDPDFQAKFKAILAQLPKHPPFRELTASLAESNSSKLRTTLMTHYDTVTSIITHPVAHTDTVYIEDGIKYCRQLLSTYPHHRLVPIARLALVYLLFDGFKCTNETECLNQAISTNRDGLNATSLPRHLEICYEAQKHHTRLLETRLNLLNRKEDLDELMQVYQMTSTSEDASSRRWDPYPTSIDWSLMARLYRHPSASTAYDCAMSSMQARLATILSVGKQHSHLVSTHASFKTLPLDYASYQIHINQLERAVETLERGRTLLWSEMRGLRTSMNRIRLGDSQLADRFATVNQELEKLTLKVSANDSDDSGDDGKQEMGTYHRVVRQQRLLDEREKLISQIQAIPGFDLFLKPLPFDALNSTAAHGPVIIINHSKWRSDIIILVYNSPPTLIPTSDDFYARANKLQEKLVVERKKGLESNTYEDALRSVLEELYELVGRPVIRRLNELDIPEQARVWWCPTSVFCSLPLHAMGPIPSNVGPPRYFLDLYISSYTPSLSALIESKEPDSQAMGKPSILLVAQPDEKMPMGLREMKAIQDVNTHVKTLFAAKAKPTAVLAHLRDHRFVHIVCHGILEPGKPFEASFKLHRGKHLLLLDITRSQLPNAEFAFLSACHTAQLTDESIEDEVLHLTAAMQFCGFRSVVGTMWAMADKDGPDLAKFFYESVFSDEWQDVRYYERTAKALRDAVVKLRTKKAAEIGLERWVNFVHYGA